MSSFNSGYSPQMFSPDQSFYTGRVSPQRLRRGAGAGGTGGAGGAVEEEDSLAPLSPYAPAVAPVSTVTPRLRNATIGVGSAAVNEAAPISPYPLNTPYPQNASPRALLAGNDLMREGNFAAAMHNPDGTMKPGATPTGTNTTLPNGTVVPQYAETPAVQSARTAAYGPYVQNKANILGGNYFQGQQFAGDANNRLNNESTARVDQGESLAAVNNAGAEQTTLNGPYLRAGSAARTSNVKAQTGQIAPNATAERGLIGAEADAAKQGGVFTEQRYKDLMTEHGKVQQQLEASQRQVDSLTKALARRGKFDDLLDEDGSAAGGTGGAAAAKPIPADLARKYLQQAGGDKVKAKAAAKAAGYDPSQIVG